MEMAVLVLSRCTYLEEKKTHLNVNGKQVSEISVPHALLQEFHQRALIYHKTTAVRKTLKSKPQGKDYTTV